MLVNGEFGGPLLENVKAYPEKNAVLHNVELMQASI